MFPLRDDNPRHGPPLVTWALVGLALACFLIQLGLMGPGPARTLLEQGAFVPRAFFADPVGRASTLVSSAFLHGDLVHLSGNLFFLYVFGDNVEDRMGHLRFAAFYLCGAVLAALAHGMVRPSSPVAMVGASGAISAVLGAYILLFPRRRVLAFVAPLFVPWLVMRVLLPVPAFFLLWLPAWLYIGYWALINLFEAGGMLLGGPVAAGGVAWWAHVGGFAFGLTAASWFARPRGGGGGPQTGSIRP